MEMIPQNFPNFGYILMKFDEDELSELKSDVQSMIELNFKSDVKYNNHLAGNIEKEYEYNKLHVIDKLISPGISLFQNEYPIFLTEYDYFAEKCTPDIKLINAWINFQTKHEFNPMHTHSGVFSFVIWLDIPYNSKNENIVSSVKNSNTKMAGKFQFIYLTSLGKISSALIDTDVNMINSGIVFPAKLPHIVYPFYTSNEYRISVSGNYKFII